VRKPPRIGAATVLLAAVLLLAGCVAPAFDSGAFTANGAAAVDSALSETRTTALVVAARLAGRVTHQAADVVVTGSEDAMGPVQDSFGNVDAPSRADDALRARVVDLLDQAASAITAARVAVRREDRPAMIRAVAQLNRVADQLDAAAQELS
jgi:hypothetical protein